MLCVAVSSLFLRFFIIRCLGGYQLRIRNFGGHTPRARAPGQTWGWGRVGRVGSKDGRTSKVAWPHSNDKPSITTGTIKCLLVIVPSICRPPQGDMDKLLFGPVIPICRKQLPGSSCNILQQKSAPVSACSKYIWVIRLLDSSFKATSFK